MDIVSRIVAKLHYYLVVPILLETAARARGVCENGENFCSYLVFPFLEVAMPIRSWW